MRRPITILAACAALASLAGCGAGEPEVAAIGADGESSVAAADVPLESFTDTAPSAPVTTPPASVALPASVAVVGDSLTESAAGEIEATLAGRGIATITIEGLTNRRMVRVADGVPPGTEAVSDVLAAPGGEPDLWVIALGTNDVGGAASPEEFAADMRTLLGGVPADAPVVWVDVFVGDMDAESRAANAVIRDVLAARPEWSVVDWYSRGDDVGVITDDGVHLTDDGQWIFANDIADAVLALGA